MCSQKNKKVLQNVAVKAVVTFFFFLEDTPDLRAVDVGAAEPK